MFGCLATGCKHKIRRFLDTSDRASTGNMRKHVRSCWGEDILKMISEAKDLETARNGVKNYAVNGSITIAFERKGQGKATYSHKQHSRTETKYVATITLITSLRSLMACSRRAEIVRWVAESLRPFEIVDDRGFQCLMKTGRPEYYIPHKTTVSRDVRLVFANVRKRIAKMLQVSTHFI